MTFTRNNFIFVIVTTILIIVIGLFSAQLCKSYLTEDIANVIQTVNRIGSNVDSHDWKKVREQFADMVMVDYTSLAGGKPQLTDADDLVKQWQSILPGFDLTQHLVGSHVVTIDHDKAVCKSQFQAYHTIKDAEGGEHWVLGGHYIHQLNNINGKWTVTGVTMIMGWQQGNEELFKLAASRMKK